MSTPLLNKNINMQLSRKYSLLTVLMLVAFVSSKCQNKSSDDNTITNEDTSFIRNEYHLTNRKNFEVGDIYETWTNNKDTSKTIIKLYIDNRLAGLVSYREKLQDGIFLRCYENTTLWIRANYVNGKKHGYFKYYDEKGKLFAIEEYDHGVLLQTKEVK